MNQVCIMLLFLKSFMPKSINFTNQGLLIIKNAIQVLKSNERLSSQHEIWFIQVSCYHSFSIFILFTGLTDNYGFMLFFLFTIHYRSFFMAWVSPFFINLGAVINTTNEITSLSLSVICAFNQTLLLLDPNFESDILLQNFFCTSFCWNDYFCLVGILT